MSGNEFDKFYVYIYIDTFKVCKYMLGYYNLSIFFDNVIDICKIKNWPYYIPVP